MMNLRLKTSAIKLLVLSAAFSAHCYSSDYEFGYSNNAALGDSSWNMPSSLFPIPSASAVDINGVFYRYTAVKELEDPYTVSIQNQAANASGYIFRSTDDWSGGSGGTIQKYIPLPYSSLGDWGDGEIEQVGIGHVEDPVVLYSYRFDPSRLQQQEAYDFSAIPAYNALSDRYVLSAIEPTDPELYEFQEEQDEEVEDERLETALAASENALTIGMSVSQSAMVAAMNTATNLSGYYAKKLQGGELRETVVLIDKNIPDNRRALRSLGQDKLHTKMVNQQYGR